MSHNVLNFEKRNAYLSLLSSTHKRNKQGLWCKYLSGSSRKKEAVSMMNRQRNKSELGKGGFWVISQDINVRVWHLPDDSRHPLICTFQEITKRGKNWAASLSLWHRKCHCTWGWSTVIFMKAQHFPRWAGHLKYLLMKWTSTMLKIFFFEAKQM